MGRKNVKYAKAKKRKTEKKKKLVLSNRHTKYDLIVAHHKRFLQLHQLISIFAVSIDHI